MRKCLREIVHHFFNGPDKKKNFYKALNTRALRYECLEQRQLLSITPSIGWLEVSTSKVYRPDNFTLTAENVQFETGHSLTVSFYRDNGDGSFNPATDSLLGSDSSGSWSITAGSINIPTGTQVYFAQARDNTSAIDGNVVSVNNIIMQDTLTTSLVANKRVDLSWSYNTTGMDIEKSTDGTNFSYLNSVSSSQLSYSVATGLNPGTRYWFRVKPIGGASYSNVLLVTTTQNPPDAPTNLAISDIGADHVDLTWENSANPPINQDEIYIEYAQVNSTTFSYVTASGTATDASVTGLSNNTQYQFRIRAHNSDFGYSTYSNLVLAKTTSSPSLLASLHIDSTWNNGSDYHGYADLSWINCFSSAAHYAVEMQKGLTGWNNLVTINNPDIVQYQHPDNFTPLTDYSFRVTAYDSSWNQIDSPIYSNDNNAVNYNISSAPYTPNATIVGNHVNLSWTGSASSYWILYAATSSPWSLLGTSASASFSTPDLIPAGNTYNFKVGGVDSMGNTVESNSASCTFSTNNYPTIPIQAHAAINSITTNQVSLSVLGADEGGENKLTYFWYATVYPEISNCIISPNYDNNAKNCTVTFNAAGAYTFRVDVIDQQGLVELFMRIVRKTSSYLTSLTS